MSGEIIYVCKCGCEVPKSGIYRSRISSGTRDKCREHKQPVLERKKICMDCGEFFILKDRGPGGFRCPPCAKEEMKRKRKIKVKVYPKTPMVAWSKWSVDKRGDYCRLLPSCTSRQCSGCREFVGVFPRVDPEKWLVSGVRK